MSRKRVKTWGMGTTFIVTLRCTSRTLPPEIGFRRFLKVALRTFGLKCDAIRVRRELITYLSTTGDNLLITEDAPASVASHVAIPPVSMAVDRLRSAKRFVPEPSQRRPDVPRLAA
jgi:hypothetical protein